MVREGNVMSARRQPDRSANRTWLKYHDCPECCAGLYIDGKTLRVKACPHCARFETDQDAAACAEALIDLLRRMNRRLTQLRLADTVADALHALNVRAGVGGECEHSAIRGGI